MGNADSEVELLMKFYLKKDILEMIAKRNLSQAKFAKAIESTPSYFCLLVQHKRIVGPDLRERILNYLRCRFDEVFEQR